MNNAKPYQVLDSCTRFPASQTIFARMDRDPAFMERMKPTARKGFWSPEETALGDAIWSLSHSIEKIAYDKKPPQQTAGDPFLTDDWLSFTKEVKSTAAFMGAALTGITRVNRLWVYGQHDAEIINEELDTAVVMAVEMDRDMIAKSPSVQADTETARGYAKMAFLTAGVTNYIRSLGWRAIGCGNDTALSIPLAIDSGLGECGRNGMLTTGEFGSCVRVCKVFTDMSLTADHPVSFGMAKTCETCRKCVNACPAGAICSGEKTYLAPTVSNNAGVLKWPVDGAKCREFWGQNHACCSNCIAACPYT